jgi:hypothetical protein
MYSRCIFCARPLGRNEAIESFPVGRSVAFDAARGRLWAVCRACGRWNLAPIEERWESVEAVERIFRDSRVRVQSENIGLTRFADGTRLIRIGRALPGELAVLRYGGTFIRRRRGYYAAVGAGAATGAAIVASVPLVIAAGVPVAAVSLTLQIAGHVRDQRMRRRVIFHSPSAEAGAPPIIIRRPDLHRATLSYEPGRGTVLRVPPEESTHVKRPDAADGGTDVVLTGRDAERAVARALTDYNARGASQKDVRDAIALLGEAGNAHAFVAGLANKPLALIRPGVRPQNRPYSLRQLAGTFRGEILPVTKYRSPFTADLPGAPIGRLEALALEMAFNEERERVALEGELQALEAAWREAEEIAAIADAIPFDLNERVESIRRSLRGDR